mgnify:CR=1 FL=1
MNIPKEFEDVFQGVELTEDEIRTLTWVTGWEHRTVENLRSAIQKAQATAISTLQIENQALRNSANGFKAENEKLRAELERVKRERDAAVASWRGFCAKCAWNGKQYLADGKMDDRCKTCRENGKCNWQWRGQKEDGNG